jgi:hypothetical protein
MKLEKRLSCCTPYQCVLLKIWSSILRAAEKESRDLTTQHGKDKTAIILTESEVVELSNKLEAIKLKLRVDSYWAAAEWA